MKKLRLNQSLKIHGSISAYNLDIDSYANLGLDHKTLKLSVDESLVSRINKQHTRLQKEDTSDYDYGKLIKQIRKSR